MLDLIETCSQVVGKKINYEVVERRFGDPAILVADSVNARSLLGWEPKFKSLLKIVGDAWNWHKR